MFKVLFSDLGVSVRLYFFLYTLLYFPKFNNRFILKSRVGVREPVHTYSVNWKRKEGREERGREKEQGVERDLASAWRLRVSPPGGHKQEGQRTPQLEKQTSTAG